VIDIANYACSTAKLYDTSGNFTIRCTGNAHSIGGDRTIYNRFFTNIENSTRYISLDGTVYLNITVSVQIAPNPQIDADN
jgi:hypothetical protein